jgi:hypothetical protein
VVSRQLDSGAPKASAVAEESWTAWKCDAVSCQETTADRTYLALTPILNAAGWYQPAPSDPVSLEAPGNWAHWTNITGLVAGVTRYGEELGLCYTQVEIAGSALRDRLHWIWNGNEFTAP